MVLGSEAAGADWVRLDIRNQFIFKRQAWKPQTFLNTEEE